MQPRIRIGVDCADHGEHAGSLFPLSAATAVAATPRWSAAEVGSGARHGPVERRERPRTPETIPITLEAMTYGRHAADEGWTHRPPTRVPAAPPRPSPERMTSLEAGRRVARELARRVQDRLTGRSA